MTRPMLPALIRALRTDPAWPMSLNAIAARLEVDLLSVVEAINDDPDLELVQPPAPRLGDYRCHLAEASHV